MGNVSICFIPHEYDFIEFSRNIQSKPVDSLNLWRNYGKEPGSKATETERVLPGQDHEDCFGDSEGRCFAVHLYYRDGY